MTRGRGMEDDMNRLRLFTLAGLAAVAVIGAPTPATTSEARPMADEQCLAQCDVRTDRCMEAAGGDERKQQACDDAYTECLQRCR